MKDHLLDRIVKFDKLLGITALTIAFVAAFFSVYGIATLFSGAFFLTAIMASSLEIGKLVSVTFLYRYWNETSKFLKTYLSMAIVVLMLITSLGIFGYLSSAYQKSTLEFGVEQNKIVQLEGQKTFYNQRIEASRTRIQELLKIRNGEESRLNQSSTNTIFNPAFFGKGKARDAMLQFNTQTTDLISKDDANITSENQKIQDNINNIQKIDDQISGIRLSQSSKKDIRTFQFVADQFGTTLDKVAKWFILAIIFVFDPLAVALILSYNVAVFKNIVIGEKNIVITPKQEVILDTMPITLPVTPPIKKDTPISNSSEIDAEAKRVFKL